MADLLTAVEYMLLRLGYGDDSHRISVECVFGAQQSLGPATAQQPSNKPAFDWRADPTHRTRLINQVHRRWRRGSVKHVCGGVVSMAQSGSCGFFSPSLCDAVGIYLPCLCSRTHAQVALLTSRQRSRFARQKAAALGDAAFGHASPSQQQPASVAASAASAPPLRGMPQSSK